MKKWLICFTQENFGRIQLQHPLQSKYQKTKLSMLQKIKTIKRNKKTRLLRKYQKKLYFQNVILNFQNQLYLNQIVKCSISKTILGCILKSIFLDFIVDYHYLKVNFSENQDNILYFTLKAYLQYKMRSIKLLYRQVNHANNPYNGVMDCFQLLVITVWTLDQVEFQGTLALTTRALLIECRATELQQV